MYYIEGMDDAAVRLCIEISILNHTHPAMQHDPAVLEFGILEVRDPKSVRTNRAENRAPRNYQINSFTCKSSDTLLILIFNNHHQHGAESTLFFFFFFLKKRIPILIEVVPMEFPRNDPALWNLGKLHKLADTTPQLDKGPVNSPFNRNGLMPFMQRFCLIFRPNQRWESFTTGCVPELPVLEVSCTAMMLR
jgi:hypothetical protein